MLKSDLVQTDKHSIIILLRRKNLRFLRRTNHIQTRWATYKKPAAQIAHLVFADTNANTKKTKRAIFCHRSPRIMRIEI